MAKYSICGRWQKLLKKKKRREKWLHPILRLWFYSVTLKGRERGTYCNLTVQYDTFIPIPPFLPYVSNCILLNSWWDNMWQLTNVLLHSCLQDTDLITISTSDSESLIHNLLGLSFFPWPCGFHAMLCLVMLVRSFPSWHKHNMLIKEALPLLHPGMPGGQGLLGETSNQNTDVDQNAHSGLWRTSASGE